MDIKKHTGYFHDGCFLLAKRDGEKLEIWLHSCEVELSWMNVDPSILSKSNYIIGKLTLFGIKNIFADGISIQQIRDDWDDGEILDFEINDDTPNEVIIQLNISWCDYPPKPRESLFEPIVIRAERYEWENLPDYPIPD